MNDEQIEPWRIWRDAAQTEGIDAAIRALYADVDAAVAERRPVCNASGRCCKFEAYGHRLYVTGLEISWFVHQVGDQSRAERKGVLLPQYQPTPNCAYQVNGLCSTHTIRPLGCRVFFCEEGTEAWQQDTTERFLSRLKALHTEHDLPYSYMEWRAGLAEASKVYDDSI